MGVRCAWEQGVKQLYSDLPFPKSWKTKAQEHQSAPASLTGLEMPWQPLPVVENSHSGGWGAAPQTMAQVDNRGMV